MVLALIRMMLSRLARNVVAKVTACIVVADRDKNVVKIYDSKTGDVKGTVQPKKAFHLPSDMTTLPDGRLVLTDGNGLQLFDEEGVYLQPITPDGVFGKCYGVASDGEGNILTINTNPKGIPNCITRQGETDILRIDFETNTILEKIELVDIISDNVSSKCRFLNCEGSNVYVVDLGLNRTYIFCLRSQRVKMFGGAGKKLGEFKDPAGIEVDSRGDMIIAGAGNNRLQVFDQFKN